MLNFRVASVYEIDDWMCHRLQEAMRTLLAAAAYADKANTTRDAFAVSLHCIQQCGLYECDLHWLVSQAYIVHIKEFTALGDQARKFMPGGLTIGSQSCFALTDEGEEFANALCACQSDQIVNSAIGRNGLSTILPQWDGDRRELYFRGHLVKRFRLPSPNQIAVLSAFEEENWPNKIDDPLPPCNDQDPKRRLHDTIRNLNRSHRLRMLRFVGDGTGQGVLWIDC